jgi:hypothetical protein
MGGRAGEGAAAFTARQRFRSALALCMASVGVGVLVAFGLGWLVIAALAIAALLASRLEYKVAVGFLLIFYPFSPGSIGPIPNVLVGELLIPLAFPALALAVTRAGLPLLPREGRRYGVAAGVLLLITGVHFVAGPVLDSLAGRIALGSSGLRPFYALFMYILLFFMAVWVLDWLPKNKESWARVFTLLLIASIALSVLRIITVTLAIDTPLLTGVFDYGGRTALAGGTLAFRMGGLAETAGLGLACLAALWTMRVVSPRVAVPVLLWLLVCVGLSGGRSLTLGVAAALFAYLVGPGRGRRLSVILGGLLVVGVALAVALSYGYASQIDRLLALEGGIEQQDPARAEIFRIMWGHFLANPLIGKGIGVAGEGLSDAFVAQQVVSGGHSSYVSMLGNFGLAGAFFLWMFVFDPIWRSLHHTRRAPLSQTHTWIQGVMTFVLVQAVIRSIEYVVGGSGYQDPRMHLMAAAFVVVAAAAARGDVVEA